MQLQLDSGTGYANIGTSFLAYNDGGWLETTIDLGGLSLGPGTYSIRWDPRNLNGADTGSEFFALDGVGLQGSVVPEPTTMLLLGAGLLGLAGARRKMKK